MNPTIPHPSRLRVFVTGVKKLTLLLTLLCALSVSALNVFAENKVVTTGTVTESDKTYESVSDTAALFVTGSESSYSGTAITLIGTTNSGFAIYSGAAYLFSSTILNPSDTTGSIGTVNLNGTLHVYDSIAQGNHGGMAVIGEKSKLIADNFVVTTATTLAINIYYAGTAELRNSRVTVITDGGDGTVIGMWTNGTLKGDNLQVIHAGADGTGIINGGGGPIMLTNSEITASTGIVSLFSTISINLENTRINAGTGLDLRDTGDITIIGGAINSAGGNALLASSTARYDITISDHAAITGGITNTASGTLNVNLDASTLAGDIANTGGGTLTIILDNDSVGAGAFTGGNLIIGSDSAWNFTKDSAADLIDNHGVIHLGTPDHYIALRSDTISGDGTWFFPVNSDTGAKSTVTGSTAADSHPRGKLIVSGDGLRDPNSVVNTLVTGLNKENWIWDNFNWGLEEYTQDGHDADGNPHFIQRGTSPAGTVLNSAIAIQQAMWFAQQDSLLKRLGELRYGTRASRPPAGGTPALHNLIDNLWLRSYGQQLNVGGKVSGQAYEQLIYGVDLGTDHKFIISADSDLYLGVYAGYGRSDIDYRTPGTDGELNSYYGGLYATWLHDSGFYIDATFKAASVNNDLKAPYGNTQLTASYSDVNIGGSIEIGNKFTFQDGWFVEPQFQVNYLHILAENYTAGPMTISAQDLDALQLRLGSLFGRSIKLANGGALQPYIKISGVETISSGGTLRNGYQHTRANTDGARAELGGGIIWQLDTNNQLHLDYEASFGDKYDKPWGLTAGYRHQF